MTNCPRCDAPYDLIDDRCHACGYRDRLLNSPLQAVLFFSLVAVVGVGVIRWLA